MTAALAMSALSATQFVPPTVQLTPSTFTEAKLTPFRVSSLAACAGVSADLGLVLQSNEP